MMVNSKKDKLKTELFRLNVKLRKKQNNNELNYFI